MSYPHQIETFVREYLTARGALLERTEYGVIAAVIDRELENALGKDDWIFAFDFDAAQETPGSEFITYGNATLEKIVAVAVSGHKSVIRYYSGPANLPSTLADHIAGHLGCSVADFAIANAKRYLAPVPRFKFKVAYLSDEREEELIHVWIDGCNGKERREYATLPHIFYDSAPVELLPELSLLPPERLLSCALDALQALTVARRTDLQEMQHLSMTAEIARTESYFSTMLGEHEAKIAKAVLAKDNAQESTLRSKLESIKQQSKHHSRDIEQKYRVCCEIDLLDVALYMMPRWRINLSMSGRSRKVLDAASASRLFWDPVLNKVVD